MAILLLAPLDVWQQRRDTLDSAGDNLANLSRAFADEIDQIFFSTDIVLQKIGQAIGQAAADDRTATARRIVAESQAMISLLPVTEFVVVGADGTLLASTSGDHGAAERAAHRDQGKALLDQLRNDIGDAPEIAGPTREAGEANWSLPVLRRIATPAGDFAGIVVAKLNLDYFVHKFRRIKLSDGSALTLLRGDGLLLSRYPAVDALIGRSFAHTDLFDDHLPTASEGTFQTTSPVDQAPRLVSYAALPRHRLVVVLSVDEHTLLLPWRQQSLRVALIAIAASAAIGWLTVFVTGQVRLRENARDALLDSLEKLRRAESRYRQVIDSTSEGYWLIDPDTGLTLEVNDALCRMLGCRRDELVGHSPFEFANAWNAKTLREQMSGVLSADHRSYEVTLTRKDGSAVATQFNATTLRETDGTPAAAFALVTDISGRARYEEALVQARIAAERANLAKSEFLATMSHELRTPLNVIMGFSELIRDQHLDGRQIGRAGEYAGDILEAGRHLLDLITDILDIAKIESGRMDIEPVWSDLPHVIDAALRLCSERAKVHRVELRAQLAPKLPPIWADGRAIRQILFNLLSNSIKFTPAGGRITVDASVRDNGAVVLSVADTGCGIPATKLSSVFQPFEQADNRFNRAAGGTGLGLSLVKGLVELHGGTVAIVSAPGQGTRVTLTFPAPTAATAAKSSSKSAAAVAAG